MRRKHHAAIRRNELVVGQDIDKGGVLLALPALFAMGLLTHAELYQLPPGYYGLTSIFLLLALMALARIPSLEKLRYPAPGEWGQLLGLDRIPEVRRLREKLQILCREAGRAARHGGLLDQRQRAHDDVIRHLCEQLNETETSFPGTGLKLIYKLGSS